MVFSPECLNALSYASAYRVLRPRAIPKMLWLLQR
jgi:hypothetical protein